MLLEEREQREREQTS